MVTKQFKIETNLVFLEDAWLGFYLRFWCALAEWASDCRGVAAVLQRPLRGGRLLSKSPAAAPAGQPCRPDHRSVPAAPSASHLDFASQGGPSTSAGRD